jgi:hypothetical protein
MAILECPMRLAKAIYLHHQQPLHAGHHHWHCYLPNTKQVAQGGYATKLPTDNLLLAQVLNWLDHDEHCARPDWGCHLGSALQSRSGQHLKHLADARRILAGSKNM